MNTNSMMAKSVSREQVPDAQRSNHTADLFGAYFPLQLEPFVFWMASRLSEDYGGGYLQPVSYTHLDVYKRQANTLVDSSRLYSPAIARLTPLTMVETGEPSFSNCSAQ